MSDQTTKLLISAVLLVHGLGHGGALAALIWIGLRPESDTGGWSAARSWLVPGLTQSTATTVASIFWIVSLIGFVAALLALWGILLPADAWRPIAVGAAVVSLVGVVLFFGTWPMFYTVAAVGVDIAVLVALLWLHSPPQTI